MSLEDDEKLILQEDQTLRAAGIGRSSRSRSRSREEQSQRLESFS